MQEGPKQDLPGVDYEKGKIDAASKLYKEVVEKFAPDDTMASLEDAAKQRGLSSVGAKMYTNEHLAYFIAQAEGLI